MLVEASFLMSEYVLVEALHVNKLINVDTRLSIHDSLVGFSEGCCGFLKFKYLVFFEL